MKYEEIKNLPKIILNVYANRYIHKNTFIRARSVARYFLIDNCNFDGNNPEFEELLWSLTIKFSKILRDFERGGLLDIVNKTRRGYLYQKSNREE